MTQIKQMTTDLFIGHHLQKQICENLFYLCHLCAQNTQTVLLEISL